MQSLFQDRDWLKKAQSGEAEAFVKLVEHYEPTIRYQLACKIFDRSAIDDVCQEVFMAALKNIVSFDLEKDFLHWLRGIARNQTFKYYERQKLRRQHESEASKLVSMAEEEPAEEDENWCGELEGCLEILRQKNAQWYELLLNKYQQKKSLQELSQQIGMSVASIKMSLMRTRKSLKECILKKVKHG